MIKIDWTSEAAEAVMRLASADLRRIVDAVGEFRWRAEQDAAMVSSAVLHRVTVGGYQISYRVANEVVEVLEVKLCRGRP